MAKPEDDPVRLALTLAGARPAAVDYLAERVRQEASRPSECDPTSATTSTSEAVERLRAAHSPLFAEELREEADSGGSQPDPWVS
jgi:hypothetical protein